LASTALRLAGSLGNTVLSRICTSDGNVLSFLIAHRGLSLPRDQMMET
jgi:hypothetical protein